DPVSDGVTIQAFTDLLELFYGDSEKRRSILVGPDAERFLRLGVDHRGIPRERVRHHYTRAGPAIKKPASRTVAPDHIETPPGSLYHESLFWCSLNCRGVPIRPDPR